MLRYVEHHGLPAERVVPAVDGALATELDGHGILVTTFIAGKRPHQSRENLRQLGEALGRLHSLATPADPPHLRRRAGALPLDDLAFGWKALDRVSGVVPALRRAEYEDLRGELRRTSDCEELPSGLTWSDCQLGNALVGADGVVTLIDWQGAGQGPKLPALGWLLYSCVVQAPEGSSRATDLACAEGIMEGYSRYRTLSAAELTRLPDAVRVRPLVVAARQFAAEVERDIPAELNSWWMRYTEAESVASAVRRIVERSQ